MIDWGSIGTAIATVTVTAGTLAGGAWAWWLKIQRNQADTRADVSESNALGAVADAQQAVYRLMQDRLQALEVDMRAVREELNVERKHSRKLELHIFRLEAILRAAGMPVPDLEERV